MIPKIAKMRTKRRQTSMTLTIAGIAEKRAFTTNFKPSFLLTTLKGRRALKALSAFKLLRAYPPLGKNISMRLAQTTKKSRIFHPFQR